MHRPIALVAVAIAIALAGCAHRTDPEPVSPPPVLDEAELVERVREAANATGCTDWARQRTRDIPPAFRLHYLGAECDVVGPGGRPYTTVWRFVVTQRGEGVHSGPPFEVRVIRNRTIRWDLHVPGDVREAHRLEREKARDRHRALAGPSLWFYVPVGLAVALFVLVVILLRPPRGSRELPLVVGSFRIDHRAERPGQPRSHWTTTGDAFRPGPEGRLRESGWSLGEGRAPDAPGTQPPPPPIDPDDDFRLVRPEDRHEGPLLRVFGRAVGILLILGLVLGSILVFLRLIG